MPSDADLAPEKVPKQSTAKPRFNENPYQWFTTPQPVKRLFDRFPLVTYSSNDLPQRSVRVRDKHALYIFTTEERAENGGPSFNPGCLKWQAYLRFRRVSFLTIPSNNHASPSGALPFLLPASSPSTSVDSAAIPSHRLHRWAQDVIGQAKKPVNESEHQDKPKQEPIDGPESKASRDGAFNMRYEAYMALIDHRVRNAYLYAVYLSPPNFASIVRPNYINSSTSNLLVQLTLSYQLRGAAETELLKQAATIDVEAIFKESDKAFKALSELLGEATYFFGEAKPTLFDASVFAYMHVILDERLGWKDGRISQGLEGCQNLVQHRRRILDEFF